MKFPCAIKDSHVTANECASISLKADHVGFAKCVACPRGQAVAKTSNWKHANKTVDPALAALLAKGEDQDPGAEAPAEPEQSEQLEQAGEQIGQEPATEPSPPRTAWELVSLNTGCNTQSVLASKVGSYQGKISQLFIKLTKGIMPEGEVWERICALARCTPMQLMELANTRAAAKMKDAQQDQPPATEPQIFNGDKLPPLSRALLDAAELDPPVLLDPTAQTPLSLMGADPAEQLLTKDDMDVLQKIGEIGTGPTRGRGDPDPLAQPEPEDWDFYAPRPPQLKYAEPGFTLTPSGDIVLNTAAVNEFNLDGVTHLRPAWSRLRGAIGLHPAEQGTPGALTLQRRKGLRVINLRHFMQRYGILAKTGHYLIQRGVNVLMSAVIETQPEQLQEAS